MIQDSGERRQFETGAVRDIQEGKGRCDLLPLDVVSCMLHDEAFSSYIWNMHYFMCTGDVQALHSVITSFSIDVFDSIPNAILEVSVHYEEGAEKYGEHNWEKGIPAHCYVDSAVRHLLKMARNDVDERHDRAFLWNLMGLWWTIKNKPELNDLPFNKEKIV